MEAISSSFAAADSNLVESVVDKTLIGSSEGGRKANELVADVDVVEVSSDEESSDDVSLDDEEEDVDVEEDSDEEEESDEEEDFEEEEEDRERTRILEDVWKLKKLADFFQHPEKPVEVDGFSAGRSFFTRPDAPEGITEEEHEELTQALSDAQALKQLAGAYWHPERPLEVDDTACARNYFGQPWATEQEAFGEAEERARLVGESMLLKEQAVTYRHPEAPINMEPGTAMGRNYFHRASAPEETDEEERARILNEMKALKQLAVDYLHPEKPVVVDATAFGRNYFGRASASEQEDDESCDDREIILEEMKELKDYAKMFMHPEEPIEMDPTASGRNYFARPSAPEQEDDEYADDREIILEEMKELKESARTFMHPEEPLTVDARAGGRNYFTRPSASEQEEDEYADEREIILEEIKELKDSAKTFMHPEEPIQMDSTGARSYFDRPSAAEQDDAERDLILQEMQALKQLAVDYMHPERPVVVDATAFGRNYYSRPSAPEQEEDECADEREIILEEMKELKDSAKTFMHPEEPIQMDSTGARSYFDRPSAAEQDDAERDLILQEMKALKKLALDYMHPENPVVMDATAFGRNYFTRPSAPEQEEDEFADERLIILEEMKELKDSAKTFMHPETPLEMDPTASGRNYFSRPSAPEQEEDECADEREIILEEMKELKDSAKTYMHPERPLEIYSTASARNYFSRPSAPEQEEDEYADEREIILEEMKELKQVATDYMHPEEPFQMDSTGARSYFDRPSAEEQDPDDNERDLILQEMQALKKLAADYMHPERPLEIDPATSGRNYFSRPSAPEQEEDEYADEREIILEEMKELKDSAETYMHPERPLEMDPAAFGRSYFSRASAVDEESFAEAEERVHVLAEAAKLRDSANTFMHPQLPLDVSPAVFGRNYFLRGSADSESEDEEERARVLAEAAELRKLAVDYLHPERPLDVDPCAFGRNYFGRASAREQEEDEYADEREIILEEMKELKDSAETYMHPERPLEIDPAAFGRNYFGRASVDQEDSVGVAEERALVLAEAAALKKVATDYAHPEYPVVADATACARTYFSRASAPGQDTSEETEERARVLAEASALKKLAVDYLHPEAPVKTTDPAACGRNYFSRVSASGVAEHISTSGHANVTESYAAVPYEEHSHHDDYGQFHMDEEIFYDVRQSIVLPLPGETSMGAPKILSNKISSDEEGELSRSPSSVMLFTGALEDADHPPLPTMG